jgi:hypothetical protein
MVPEGHGKFFPTLPFKASWSDADIVSDGAKLKPPSPEKTPLTPQRWTAAYVRGSSSKSTSLHQKIGAPRASSRN